MKASLLTAMFIGIAAPSLPAQASDEVRYFSSPEEAVTRVTEMLRADDWKALASYYDLTGTETKREDLTSGRFFIHAERPPSAHPGLPWKYKHPFTPGFKFDRVEPTSDPQVVRVYVKIEIDQGGGPVQRGFSHFHLRKSAAGYQVLPDFEGTQAPKKTP